jgi:methylmalonyl-CoA mutase cobalamin-binding subunit
VSAAYDPDPKAPIIVIATPHGELHELGAMAVAAAALSAGWRVVYLGASLPAADIAAAANQVKAQVLALSVTSIDADAAARQLRETAGALPSDVSLVVGGSAAGGVARVVAALGGRVLPDVQALRRLLDEVREAASARSADRKAIA